MLPAINSVNMMTWDGHIFSLVGYREIKKMSYFGSDAASSLWVSLLNVPPTTFSDWLQVK